MLVLLDEAPAVACFSMTIVKRDQSLLQFQEDVHCMEISSPDPINAFLF